MIKKNGPDEQERALRIELGKRTLKTDARAEKEYKTAADPEYVRAVGDEIGLLMNEEKLEEAYERLEMELAKAPNELRFLNLQTILATRYRPQGDFKKAEYWAGRTMECATMKNSSHYILAALVNMGIIAQLQGFKENSLIMFLAAHFTNKNHPTPIENLAGWYATSGKLDMALAWTDRLIETCPNWLDNPDIVSFFEKDEAIINLRSYEPFKQKVLNKIANNRRR